MSRKSSKKTKPKAGSRPHQKRWSRLIVFLVLLIALAGMGAWWLRPDEVVFPELDLAEMEPPVATKIEARMAAVRASPRSGGAWGSLGTVLLAHGLDNEAVPPLEKASELAPDEFRWQYLLVHALRPFDTERALAQSAKALAVDPDYSPAHVVRAELLEQQNDMEGARQHYEKARALDPSSPMALFGVARLTLASGDAEGAIPLLERAREMDPEAGAIHASLAQAYRRLGDMDRAASEARLAFLKKNPVAIPDPIHFAMRQESVSSLAQLDRAMKAAEAGDFRRAASIFEGLVALRPDDPHMHSRYGDVLSQLDQADEAKKQYLAALGIDPEHPGALYGLANLLNMEGAYDEAEARYRSALAVRPDHVATLLNLGSLLAFKGDAEAAEAMLRRGLEIDASDFGCHFQLGELLLRNGRSKEAAEEFRAALVVRPEYGPVHGSLAIALARQGKFEDSWTHVQKARSDGFELPSQFIDGLRAQLPQGAGARDNP